jgi:GT2 family glycosyltransferase
MPWRGGYGHPLDAVQETGETFSPCAAAALYSRKAFMEAGGFDESFFCYLEDIDLGFRLRLLGERCIQVRNAVVSHEGSASSGRRSYFTLFHSARNRVWVILKNMPISLLVLLLPLHIMATAWLLFRVHDPSWRRATFAGIRSSLANIPGILRSRSRVQHCRQIGTFQLAKALNWNINALRERRPDIRLIS